ncbi:hypothetical protein [Ureibacillus aquaedulcis]|uniref:Uncharacterized protein n=1 Tax=Ureibacillus aquaedulcis TaxID=3058421 RepID=A0ABT8GUG6_9BACL|nr:hypothetical protein [Ureibacillus sp. BA0131]MDN4495054.1 hypothetical protein [Ureibacillus sp. BA0131]
MSQLIVKRLVYEANTMLVMLPLPHDVALLAAAYVKVRSQQFAVLKISEILRSLHSRLRVLVLIPFWI